MMPGSKRGSRGLMLIELMIAMLIGLFLIGGAIAVFIASKRSYTETEAFSRMGESGRFALQLLITDLRRAGFFGEVGAAGIERSGSAFPGRMSAPSPDITTSPTVKPIGAKM